VSSPTVQEPPAAVRATCAANAGAQQIDAATIKVKMAVVIRYMVQRPLMTS
jgi:hypothetical protein